MKKLLIIELLVLFFISGCAKKADSIKPTYVSPIEYNDLSCKELKKELIKVNQTLTDLSAKQDEDSEKENTFAMAVLMIGFISIDVDGPQEAEIGRLKGRSETIKDVAAKKNCSFAAGMP